MSEEICIVCGLDRGNHDACGQLSGSSYHKFIPKPRQFKVGDAVQTRDGRKARIIVDDAKCNGGMNPLVAIVTEADGREWVASFGPQGQFSVNEKSDDLVPAPAKRAVWVTWWGRRADGLDGVTLTEAVYYNSGSAQKDGAVACIKVEIEEGRFDQE